MDADWIAVFSSLLLLGCQPSEVCYLDKNLLSVGRNKRTVFKPSNGLHLHNHAIDRQLRYPGVVPHASTDDALFATCVRS